MNDAKFADEVLAITASIKTDDRKFFRPLYLSLTTIGFISLVASAFGPMALGIDARHNKPIIGNFDVMHCFLASVVVILMGAMFRFCHVIGRIKELAKREKHNLS